MPKDILFIHPANQKKTYQDLSREYTAVATPVWTSLLAGYTRNKGYSTAVYDVNIEDWNENTPAQIVAKYNPGLIVMMVYGHNPSASTQTMPAAGRIAGGLKNYNRHIPIAMGGLHPSALPERTLAEESIDFVIQGEGPYTIEGLLGWLKKGRALEDVRGLWFRSDGKIKANPPAELVGDLDAELGDYAWGLLPEMRHYRAHNMHCFQDFAKSRESDFSDVRSPYATLNTSLGCPYSCHYCCINAVFGKPAIRYWSLKKVLSWIDELVTKHGIRNIRLDDELFILSPQRVEEFCDLIIERGYRLNLWVYGRVDTIRESLLKKMKKAGINWICLGIESGNSGVRESVNKSIHKDIKGIVKMLQSNDIYVLGNYMFGLPQDDLGTMEETFRLAAELNCEFINFYSAMAYPGSRLYEDALRRGYSPESWGSFSQHSYETRPLPTEHISAQEVLKFRDEAFHKYYADPAYLRMMESRFGAAVRKHIENMLEIRIKRKILGD